ncbi:MULTISPECIES: FadR/GntR family transcriptional regulator [unclassified Sphingomonas]|uniref:FadR/GntR family transcriptional regulator n=1 Tax=unclassified Sphingomonas TaxID=196159 RepID=UPI002150F218|nr:MULTISPECIES: GntR family transcriptional regulator [unclassified Sphingomonas]MCR5871033.1 GntR family transcriptional regulator [Sphingomonas sp. J344]UUY00646.1 GntR family transcriptional regulator [Sphingomonas sp. J315]
MPRPKHRPLTQSVAQELRRISLSEAPGVFLGSEKDLMGALGVSRPTFRQAVNLIEHEQLLSVVRGVKGGIFSRRPDIGGVISSASTFLISRGTTLGDLLLTTTSLLRDAAALAAGFQDEALRARAGELLKTLAAAENTPQDLARFQHDEITLITLLCEMGSNPAVELLLRMMYSLGVSAFPSIFEGREDLMQFRRTARVRLLSAIVAGDVEQAQRASRQNAHFSRSRIDPSLLDQRMITPGTAS